MDTIQLTPEETEWLAGMIMVNHEVTDREYVVMGPDGEKHWVCVFNKDYLSRNFVAKSYEVWSPLSNKGQWNYFGDPAPDWVAGLPQTLIVEDGFSLEEIEQAEQIMEGL